MEKPKSLNVFGQKVRIKYCKDMIKKEGSVGEHCSETNTIRLDDSLADKELCQTLIHELVHAVFTRTGLRQAIEPHLEEIVAENLATALIENFKLEPF